MPRVRVAPREKRIERRNEKRQTVDARNGRELQQRGICRSWIAKQVPRKTDFRQVRAKHLERNPEERSAGASKRDTSQREPVDRPSDRAVRSGPNRGNQQQDAPSTSTRESPMHGERLRDPRDGRQHKTDAVQKSAGVCHAWSRAKEHDQQNSHAYPGIDAEIKARVGKRESRAGNRGDKQPQPCGTFTSGMRTEIAEPRTPRHQCLTMALKPATSRPFLAFSTAFWSAYGPTSTW